MRLALLSLIFHSPRLLCKHSMDDFAPYQWQTESAFVEAQSISRLSVQTLGDIPRRKKTDFHFPQQYQREKQNTQKKQKGLLCTV